MVQWNIPVTGRYEFDAAMTVVPPTVPVVVEEVGKSNGTERELLHTYIVSPSISR